ncbi:MAG: hypothetical protein HFH23_00985 [Ruminococcus sp.]|nr:hypothetical protein [Ruminococcus sp.]
MKCAKTQNAAFLAVLAVFAASSSVRYFSFEMSMHNTTPFALSYKYGFISRGLMGTLWAFFDGLTSKNLMNYRSLYTFSLWSTVLYLALLFVLFAVCLKRCREKDEHNMRYLICFLGVFAFQMFWSDELFGRLDVYLMILTTLGMILLVEEKWEWLVIPFSIICVMIHQGFVFVSANLMLVPLFYKILTCRGKKRKRYIVIFALTFLSISVLFLYFELFSHVNGPEIFDEVVASAKALSEDGKGYATSLLNHEILGKDVFEEEWEYHVFNYKEFPTALLLFSPYIVIGLSFFKKLIGKGKKTAGGDNALSGQKDAARRFAYLVLFVGVATVLPEMILKVDYGRYMFRIFYYYISMVMMFMAMGDTVVADQVEETKEDVKGKVPVPMVVLLYPMFLTPFYDVIISGAVHKLSVWFFGGA